MYDFILQLFLITSLAIIIYLMARALPRIEEGGPRVTAYDYLEGWVKKLPLAKIDNSLNIYVEKTLRKTRVVVMRFDNFLHNHLNNKKNGDQNGSSVEFLKAINKKDDL